MVGRQPAKITQGLLMIGLYQPRPGGARKRDKPLQHRFSVVGGGTTAMCCGNGMRKLYGSGAGRPYPGCNF